MATITNLLRCSDNANHNKQLITLTMITLNSVHCSRIVNVKTVRVGIKHLLHQPMTTITELLNGVKIMGADYNK
jgi:hypothetical protein